MVYKGLESVYAAAVKVENGTATIENEAADPLVDTVHD